MAKTLIWKYIQERVWFYFLIFLLSYSWHVVLFCAFILNTPVVLNANKAINNVVTKINVKCSFFLERSCIISEKQKYHSLQIALNWMFSSFLFVYTCVFFYNFFYFLFVMSFRASCTSILIPCFFLRGQRSWEKSLVLSIVTGTNKPLIQLWNETFSFLKWC